MDYELKKTLQATADAEPLISETFTIEGQLTDLALYPQTLQILQKGKNRIIPIQFGLSFAILKGNDDQPIKLELIFGDEKIVLERSFWSKAEKWENTLLKYLTRKDFHPFFQPIKRIGRGNFATVYWAKDLKGNRDCAIKAFTKELAYKGDGQASIQNQVKLMRKLKHPNLIQFYGAYQTTNSLYLSMQYAKGINLEAFMKKHRETTIQQRRKILKGLLMGLKQLSKLRLVHRDLKPQNIMLTQDFQQIKIVDFGLATHIDEKKYIFVRCGTPGYVAPQILRIKDIQTVKLGLQSDMFSLGALYYQLIYGHPLFKGRDQAEVLILNRYSKIKLARNEKAAFGQLQLLQDMLQTDPFYRIKPQAALRSNFFRSSNQIFCRAFQPIQEQKTGPIYIQ